MKTFGSVIRGARKAAGLTQKQVAGSLRRGAGRRVMPPWLNDSEHDRRYPPEDSVIEQLAGLLRLSSNVLYFYAKRIPCDARGDFDSATIEAGYRAFWSVLNQVPKKELVHSLRHWLLRIGPLTLTFLLFTILAMFSIKARERHRLPECRHPSAER
jgi:transcriptional regulator with XRE-family HTH domain